jgi:4'-phosphopantetheinyl transferase
MLTNCFNEFFSSNLSVKPMLFSEVSVSKEVRLFLFDSNAINEKMLDFISEKYLHQNETLTLHQRKKQQAKQEFIISRMLIKQLFLNGSSKALQKIEIRFNKESLLLEVFYLDKRQPFSISLSHSKGLIFLAVSLNDVSLGVDIEHIKTKRNIHSLAKNYYHLTEVEQVEQRGVDAFYRIWTLKEAISKHLKQPIVTTLKQNIFKRLPLLSYQSGVYNGFDLSFVCDKAEHSSINNSINIFASKDFLNLFTDTTDTDFKAANEKT